MFAPSIVVLGLYLARDVWMVLTNHQSVKYNFTILTIFFYLSEYLRNMYVLNVDRTDRQYNIN